MVGDDHRLAAEGFSQHCRQPFPAGLVQLNGVLGGEMHSMILDDGEIRHSQPRLMHGIELVRLAEQGEVSPQDAAQEAYTVDDDLVVVQYVNVIASCCLQLISQGNIVVVELVVSRHIDHGGIRESGFHPVQTFHPHADIASQDDDIRSSCRRRELFKLDVQIIQDVEFHGTTLHQ